MVAIGDLVRRTTEPNKREPEKVLALTADRRLAYLGWESGGVRCVQWVSVSLLRPWVGKGGH